MLLHNRLSSPHARSLSEHLYQSWPLPLQSSSLITCLRQQQRMARCLDSCSHMRVPDVDSGSWFWPSPIHIVMTICRVNRQIEDLFLSLIFFFKACLFLGLAQWLNWLIIRLQVPGFHMGIPSWLHRFSNNPCGHLGNEPVSLSLLSISLPFQ